jgi:aspartyl-tRNA(Asn)/glutamyl-tRNA(Gln) amidotransferase subunit A
VERAPDSFLDGPVVDAVGALRRRDITAVELVGAAVARHARRGAQLAAYKHFDAERALLQATLADEVLDRAAERGEAAPPLCGIPVSVKDIYGVEGMPTFAGSAHRLPTDPWSHDAWLVERVREAGGVFMGKTHTVEFAYGGVGINPHWGTPRNPWDPDVARIPGGSSCGAGVSLWEGSAMLALGSDTGGSIRIPAAFTGVVGHKTTKGRLATSGATQLSSTFDTVGALTRTVADSVWFFGSVDPKWGDPESLAEGLETTTLAGLRIAIPRCRIWEECQADVARVALGAVADLGVAGAELERPAGTLLDDAYDHYMSGGIGKAEVHAFLSAELPEWIDRLHPTVGARIANPIELDSPAYREAISRHRHLAALADTLFDGADVLALPANLVTPPPVAELAEDLGRYKTVNLATLHPTCPVNMLGLCAISLPAGRDDAGMPVGLQLVARAGDDEALLGIALAAERALGTAEERRGLPPLLRD